MGEIGGDVGGIAIEIKEVNYIREENSDMLVFNVFTGELKTIPALKFFGVDGITYLHATYPPDCWPVFGNIQPRYDIRGNYIGFTNDDSGEIKRLTDPRFTDPKETLAKYLRRWLLIGSASLLLLIITLLLIYYDIGSRTLMQILASAQFTFIIIAILYYLKMRKFKKPAVA